MELTLLVLAAGMGSRYGGLKQLDQLGPSGETVMDYSVYDAMRAGFNRVVFIIRRDFEEEFKKVIGSRYADKIKLEYAFQDKNDLPGGFTVPEGREKPWGTGHAVYAARELLTGPFAVINADDFYGADSYKKLAAYLTNLLGKNTLGREDDKELNQQFVGYAMVVIFVLNIISGLFTVSLLRWIFQFYTVFVVYEGARTLMGVDEKNLTRYSLIASVIIMVCPSLIATVFDKLSLILN